MDKVSLNRSCIHQWVHTPCGEGVECSKCKVNYAHYFAINPPRKDKPMNPDNPTFRALFPEWNRPQQNEIFDGLKPQLAAFATHLWMLRMEVQFEINNTKYFVRAAREQYEVVSASIVRIKDGYTQNIRYAHGAIQMPTTEWRNIS